MFKDFLFVVLTETLIKSRELAQSVEKRRIGILSIVLLLVLMPSVLAAAQVQHSVDGNKVTFTLTGTPPYLINIRADGDVNAIGQNGGYAWIRATTNSYTVDLPFIPATQKIVYGVREASDTAGAWVKPSVAVGLGVVASEGTGTGGSGTGTGTGSGTGTGGSSVAADPCPENLPEAQQKKHVMKFIFEESILPSNDAVALEFAKTNLKKYVEHMNCILRKNTNRRLVFDPNRYSDAVQIIPDGTMRVSAQFDPSVICKVSIGSENPPDSELANICSTRVYLDANNQRVTILQSHQITSTRTGNMLECKKGCYDESLSIKGCSDLLGQQVAPVKICPDNLQTGTSGNLLLPTEGFEVWAYIGKSTETTSGGGFQIALEDGEGGLTRFKWVRIYDPDTLLSNTITETSTAEEPLFDYWTQINNLLHEFGHVFDAAVGEFYNIAILGDNTQIAPSLNVDIGNLARGITDPYWSSPDKASYIPDPMTNNILSTTAIAIKDRPNTLQRILGEVKYSDLTAAMLNGEFRGREDFAKLPNLESIKVRIIDENGNLIPGATITLFRVNSKTETQFTKILDNMPTTNGELTFNWGWKNANKELSTIYFDTNNARLIKVQAPGFQPAGKWVTIFDAQEVKLLKNQNEWVIEVRLQRVS